MRLTPWTVLCCFMVMPLMAKATDSDISTQLAKCKQISDQLQRLQCYEAISNKVNEPSPATVTTSSGQAAPIRVVTLTPSQQTQASPAVTTQQQAPVQPSATDRFGLPYKADEDLDQLESKVTKVEQDLRKRLQLTLENGHEWQQIDTASLMVKVGDTATIESGMLGSFLLGVKGSNRKIRVRRVK